MTSRSPTLVLPLQDDSGIRVTAFSDTKVVHIRFAERGFIKRFLFMYVLGTLEGRIHNETDNITVERLDENRVRFFDGPVTVTARLTGRKQVDAEMQVDIRTDDDQVCASQLLSISNVREIRLRLEQLDELLETYESPERIRPAFELRAA